MSTSTLTRGIIFVAAGAQYVQEAMAAARACERHMGGVSRSIFVDDPRHVTHPSLFEHVLPYDPAPSMLNGKSHFFLGRIPHLARSPYDLTLSIDSDIHIVQPCHDLFDLVTERFEFGAAHAPVRVIHALPDLPDSFPEVNAGLLVYRNTEAVQRLFKAWSRVYGEQLGWAEPPRHDQPSLRRALYESDVRFTILPPEYNLRTPFPFMIGGNARVKVLHGRVPNAEAIAQQVNGAMTWQPRIGKLGK
ncbi:MAG: hypothetical protein KDA21_14645 [Phycisphaerales bacterium]|nr:hypothetical protein [Phycisphaerales bacterium]